MSSQSPVVKMKKRVNLLFPALKIVAGFGEETEAATAKRKIGAEVVAGKVLSK
jgi:hypothetical protein